MDNWHLGKCAAEKGGPAMTAPSILTKRLRLLALALGATALFFLVDVPQTVRIKSLVINMLPLNPKTKHNVIENLCNAASVGSANPSSSSWNCALANDITMAANQRALFNDMSAIAAEIYGEPGLVGPEMGIPGEQLGAPGKQTQVPFPSRPRQ
jgi:hypothetical protein